MSTTVCKLAIIFNFTSAPGCLAYWQFASQEVGRSDLECDGYIDKLTIYSSVLLPMNKWQVNHRETG